LQSRRILEYVQALFTGKLLPKKQFEEFIELVDENGNPLPNGVEEDAVIEPAALGPRHRIVNNIRTNR